MSGERIDHQLQIAKTKDNLCAHVYKLNAKLKLRIDIDQKDSKSNFAITHLRFLRCVIVETTQITHGIF